MFGITRTWVGISAVTVPNGMDFGGSPPVAEPQFVHL